MFSGLARRLTGWYVFVATGLVILLVGAIAVAGLLFYAHTVNEQISAASDQISDVEARAREDHETFAAAQKRLLDRLQRPGLLIRVIPPPPRLRRGTDGRPMRLLPGIGPDFRPGGPPGPRDDRALPYQQFRFGFAASAFLGMHLERRPFLGGQVVVSFDSSRVQWIAGITLASIAAMGVIAGLFAWAIGRYITVQALRPLYDVTAALQRFAARDFTAQSIEAAGGGEFNSLATAYNAAAAQVEQAFQEREAAERQMRQFVADAGHELRTPLTIVLGYIDMLRKRAGDDERGRKIFETIAIESSRMRTLIDNLVLLARLDSDERRPVEPFGLTELIADDIVAPRRTLFPSVRFDLDFAVDATIIGERTEIQEAIANVIDNAIKYAPGSPVRISVVAAGGGVDVLIADEGPGIAPEDRSQIFERFYRGARRGEVEGSGLGLAIAKRAAERAGGELTLAHTSERGTTFALRLRTDRIELRAAARA